MSEQRGAATLKGIEIGHFVVESMRLPAAIQDTYPFVGKCAYGGLMSATLIAVLAVEGARPKGLVDRLGGPFDKGLTKKGGALPAPVHPALLAAALSDRCNS